MSTRFYSPIVWVAHEKHLSGANFSLLEFMQELQQEGVKQILVVGQPGTMADRAKSMGVDVHYIPFYGWMRSKEQRFFHRYFIKHQLRNLLALFAFLRFFWRVKPELVISFTSTHVVAALAAWFLGIRHYFRISEYGQLDFGIRFAWGKCAYWFMRATSRYILVNSEALFNQYALHIPARQLQVMYNAVPAKAGSYNIDSRHVPAQPRLLMLGQILASKGHLQAVEALALLKRQGIYATLRIVGGQQDKIFLHALLASAVSHGVEGQVEVEGFVADVDRLLESHDILLMCSPHEAFGRVTVEAMHAYLPVIGANSGGTLELVLHGVTGLLYKSGSSEDLARQVKALVNGLYNVDQLVQNAKVHVSRLTNPRFRLHYFQAEEQVSQVSLPHVVWQAHESELSGANLSMIDYIQQLRAQYQFIVALPLAGSLSRRLDALGIAYWQNPHYNWGIRLASLSVARRIKIYIRNTLAEYRLRQLFRRVRPAWVFTNTQAPSVASRAANSVGVPHVWWIHEFGQADFSFTPGWGDSVAAYRWMEESSVYLVCNSQAVKESLSIHIAKAKMHVVYQPVSWMPIDLIPAFNTRAYLLFGQFTPAKGHRMVLDALRYGIEHYGEPAFRVDFIGPAVEQSYAEGLQQYISEHSLGGYVQLSFGFFAKEIVIPAYECLLVASESEAFGRVVIEAQQAGLYVLGRRSGGLPEILRPEVDDGFDNVEQLAKLLWQKRPQSTTNDMRLTYDPDMELNRLRLLMASRPQ